MPVRDCSSALFTGRTRILEPEHFTKNLGAICTLRFVACVVARIIRRRFELLAAQGDAWFMGKKL